MNSEQRNELLNVLTRDLYSYSRIGLVALLLVNIIYTLTLLIGAQLPGEDVARWCVPKYFFLMLAAFLILVMGKRMPSDRLRIISLNVLLVIMGTMLGISIVHFFPLVSNMIIMVILVLTAGTLAAAGSCLAPNKYSFLSLSLPWVVPMALYFIFFTGNIIFIAMGPLILLFEGFLIVINYQDNSRRKEAILLDFSLKDENRRLVEAKDELEAAMEELEATNESLVGVNRELEDAENEYARDMLIAANVQSSLLPVETPQSDEYDFAIFFQPMEGIAANFYDFYIADEGVQGLGIFDVTGHGISSGLLTLIAKSIIFRNFTGGPGGELAVIMEKINRQLEEEIGHANHYLTGILLGFSEGSIEYINCGHPDMICKSPHPEGVYRILDPQGRSPAGPMLGTDWAGASCKTLLLKLNKGDSLLLYTDCLIDAKNAENQPWGSERLYTSLEKSPDGTAREILNYVLEEFFCFIKERNNPGDDLTAIIIKKK